MSDDDLKELLLTDGQELRLYAMDGLGKGFYAEITGDCYMQGFDENSPARALTSAFGKYKKWIAESNLAGEESDA